MFFTLCNGDIDMNFTNHLITLFLFLILGFTLPLSGSLNQPEELTTPPGFWVLCPQKITVDGPEGPPHEVIIDPPTMLRYMKEVYNYYKEQLPLTPAKKYLDSATITKSKLVIFVFDLDDSDHGQKQVDQILKLCTELISKGIDIDHLPPNIN